MGRLEGIWLKRAHRGPMDLVQEADDAGAALGGDGWVPDPEAAPYDWMADGA